MPPPYAIAIIEDDPSQRNDLVEFLTLRHYAVQGFDTAASFFEAWPLTHFDLLLLDIVLPDCSGIDIAQQVRKQQPVHAANGSPYIIMLTALDSNHDQVIGLNAGADMHLSKRSSLDVIEAACRNALKRLAPPEPVLQGKPWTLHFQHWKLQSPDGNMLTLTHSEIKLLAALFGKPGQAVTREELLAHMDKKETLSSLRNLDNTASRLRNKIKHALQTDLPLRPSYGRGYTFTGLCEIKA